MFAVQSPYRSPLSLSLAAEEKVVKEHYDYIIAGGGLAGCVLAERLSQDGSKRVLVLEAGRPDYQATFIRIPAGILRLFRSVYDWQFETGGEKNSNGRNVFLQRGKVSLNSVHYTFSVKTQLLMCDSLDRYLAALRVRMFVFTIEDQLEIMITGTFPDGAQRMCFLFS